MKRLLDSIALQTFKNYEVIISDDSPGAEVNELISQYTETIHSIVYHKNIPSLGMPANWNHAIRLARGKWIKLMHDDDWFASSNSLQYFADAAVKRDSGFIFSAYYDVLFAKGQEKLVMPHTFRFNELKKEPVTLLSTNIIGPPSVVMHRNDGTHFYDEKLRWLVDIDMYIRRLAQDEIVYIPEPAVKVGVGDEQVTAIVHGAAEVEIPEHFYFLGKTGIRKLKHLLVYDYWWRFIRNFRLISTSVIKQYGYDGPIHPVLHKMMNWQKQIPPGLLKFGPVSKLLMTIHFFLYRKQLRDA